MECGGLEKKAGLKHITHHLNIDSHLQNKVTAWGEKKEAACWFEWIHEEARVAHITERGPIAGETPVHLLGIAATLER